MRATLILNGLNIFTDHDKMDSSSEYLLDVLTNKQHIENTNMNTLQENIINLQKQVLEKDEIISSLLRESNMPHRNIKILKNKSEIAKQGPESTKCDHQYSSYISRTTSSTSFYFNKSARKP